MILTTTMNKLTDFYTQKAALQEKGETASNEWDALEERLIKEEIMPELLQQLKATLSQVKCPLMLNVSYDPNGALAVSFTRNCMQMSMHIAKDEPIVAEPVTPIAEEIPETETPSEDAPEQESQEEADKITRSKSIGFSVTFQDGTVIKERNAAMTFIATLQKIGLARIAKGNHNVMHMGHKVVSSDKIVSNIKKQTFVDGYYVYTHMSNADKINDIIALSRYYNLKLIVAKCEEEEGTMEE